VAAEQRLSSPLSLSVERSELQEATFRV